MPSCRGLLTLFAVTETTWTTYRAQGTGTFGS
jgi:hypothetical protein